MTSLNYDIKDKLKRITVFEKIIVINILIYIIGWCIWQIQNIPRTDSLDWLALPKEFSEFIFKPWSILTYGFAHFGFWHLLFNMMVLYFIGRSFSNLFSTKLSLNVYFLGILTGGFVFMAYYFVLPNSILAYAGPLVGASAGVHASLLFLSSYMPDYEIRLITFNIKLKYVAVALVAFDVIGLFGDNPGGNIAHLGGDALGFIYAHQLRKGKDIGKGFEKLMDSVSNLFSRSKASPLKTVHRKGKKPMAGHTKAEFDEFNKQKQIDLILDKISKSGYESLSAAEKEFLFKAGKK
ncbi:MAG: rhomboid family intramembrane serine protease [Bacteroidia bacterium]|nr:rhomboid family intramembrane serine protease [Bacteroidia bacterium]NND26389.1 rhomboid family intramembrane serine protease [Flavobacteriaceae bacterium]MBT8278187.1 rhomboid family intramembrane serine protease [Bacteroidia bacterium]NNK58983.1 rhomboid family intramembrane serine protease [Flavobacteriaceae bacterium]NNL32108.1 rhomboid family intramembrane serine protease [Flavobacteriaceae bacterium]